MAGNEHTPLGRRQPQAVRERAAGPDLVGQRRMPINAPKAQAEGQKPRLAVVHVVQDRRGTCTTKIPQAVDKHGQYGQVMTIENGQYAALICI